MAIFTIRLDPLLQTDPSKLSEDETTSSTGVSGCMIHNCVARACNILTVILQNGNYSGGLGFCLLKGYKAESCVLIDEAVAS